MVVANHSMVSRELADDRLVMHKTPFETLLFETANTKSTPLYQLEISPVRSPKKSRELLKIDPPGKLNNARRIGCQYLAKSGTLISDSCIGVLKLHIIGSIEEIGA